MLRLLRTLRYHTLHLRVYTMADLKDIRLRFTIHIISYLSFTVLLVAIGLGLYTRWMLSDNIAIPTFVICAAFVFTISCALRFYFSFEQLGVALQYLWLGCLMGLITFTEKPDIQFYWAEEVMNILFMTSLVLACTWAVTERVLHLVKHEPTLLTRLEVLESAGVLIGSLAIPNIDAISVSFLIIGFGMCLVSIRVKCQLWLLNLGVFLVISVVSFFPLLDIHVNPYGLSCYAGRLAFPPIIDLYFSGLSSLERWQPFLRRSRATRYITLVLIFLLNISFAVTAGHLTTNHTEWYIVLPIYITVGIIWLCFHVIYFISCWKLMSKITECNTAYTHYGADTGQSMTTIMASLGVRHFSLITQRLICFTLLLTVMIIGVGWETRTGYSLGMALIIFPIEVISLSLFWELGSCLGGTCTGLALVTPANKHSVRPVGGAKLIPSNIVEEIGARSTHIINLLQKFFSFHMISCHACDYSTNGFGSDYVSSKLKEYFEVRTSDGPRYDTYLLYYSGDVYDTGDWALKDNQSLKLDTIHEMWKSANIDSTSRLILILDTTYSYLWTKEISRYSDSYVAIQTCRFSTGKIVDEEVAGIVGIGDFTQDWVHHNLDADVDINWYDKTRTVKAIFGVSKYWTDFQFHYPTEADFANHWDNNFPKITKPLIRAINLVQPGSILCCSDCVTRCIRRKKMRWLPPKEIDTGHGFKLIRS